MFCGYLATASNEAQQPAGEQAVPGVVVVLLLLLRLLILLALDRLRQQLHLKRAHAPLPEGMTD